MEKFGPRSPISLKPTGTWMTSPSLVELSWSHSSPVTPVLGTVLQYLDVEFGIATPRETTLRTILSRMCRGSGQAQ